jgi:hypothetical protein
MEISLHDGKTYHNDIDRLESYRDCFGAPCFLSFDDRGREQEYDLYVNEIDYIITNVDYNVVTEDGIIFDIQKFFDLLERIYGYRKHK